MVFPAHLILEPHFRSCYQRIVSILNTILGNPGLTHSVPTAFECSGCEMRHAWVTKDDLTLEHMQLCYQSLNGRDGHICFTIKVILIISQFWWGQKFSIKIVFKNVGALRMHLLSEVYEQFIKGERVVLHAPGAFNGIWSKTYNRNYIYALLTLQTRYHRNHAVKQEAFNV